VSRWRRWRVVGWVTFRASTRGWGQVLAPGHKWCFAAPPSSVNLPPVGPWDRVGEYSSCGGRVRCRWSRARAGMAVCGLRMTAFGGRASVVDEAGEVCGRASGAVAGPKAQPVDGLGLGHGHVDQAQGAEMLCQCAGVARRSTAAEVVAAAGGGLGLIRLLCGRVWTV
jgi:hypothetical protein